MADLNEVPDFQNQPTDMLLEYPGDIISGDMDQLNINLSNELMNQVNQMNNPGNNPMNNPGNNPGDNTGNNRGNNPGNNTGNNPINYPIHYPMDSMNSNFSFYNHNFSDNLYNSSLFNDLSGSPAKIMKIRKEFNDYLINNFTEDLDINNDEEMKKTITKIDEALKQINDVMNIFDNQQMKVLDLEDKINKTIKNIEKDTEKINDFSSFTQMISSKYKDIDTGKINDSILEICKSIKKESNNLDLKNEYHKELYLLKYLFHHFIKKINQANIGSTCSMCMNNQVNTFLEPCGHTCCDKCIERYLDHNSNSKCFICREVIFKKHKLYFI